MLTRKQRSLLLFIHDRLQSDGIPPSYDEMKDELGLKSKSGIHRLITALEERGFIRRMPHRARAVEVMRLPEDMHNPDNLSPISPMVRSAKPVPEAVPLPVYGKIAAGTPIEALRDESQFIEVAASMLGPGDHYALEVDGESMIEMGINDGDTIIVRRGETARDGEVVVALVDGEEVTLKTLRKEGANIRLEAANAEFEDRILPAGRVQVQGTLAALLRKYH
ncbi:MAG: transcriptional repressor LexA [Alphaproteobacteria bacterium]